MAQVQRCKGAATALGVFLCPLPASSPVSALLLFYLVRSLLALCSLVIAAAAAMPRSSISVAPRHAPPIIVNVELAIALLVIYKHDQLSALVEGTEAAFFRQEEKRNDEIAFSARAAGEALGSFFRAAASPTNLALGCTTRTREAIRRDRENRTYLPGSKLPERVRVHPHLKPRSLVRRFSPRAMPSGHARAVYASALPFVAGN